VTYKLGAIIMDEEGTRVSIDDRLLRLEDHLEDFELALINRKSVVFDREGERIEPRL